MKKGEPPVCHYAILQASVAFGSPTRKEVKTKSWYTMHSSLVKLIFCLKESLSNLQTRIITGMETNYEKRSGSTCKNIERVYVSLFQPCKKEKKDIFDIFMEIAYNYRSLLTASRKGGNLILGILETTL